MSQREVITDLMGIQGWEVEPDGIKIDRGVVFVRIRRKPGTFFKCAECGSQYLFCQEKSRLRVVRDFPIWGRKCYLVFGEARVNCDRCGVHVEGLDWLDPHQRQTLRYEKYAANLCDILPVLDVAELEDLDKNTVYRIDRKWLKRREAQREMRPVRYLGIDEISLRKGHKYATVFYDLERREVIGLVKGRKQRNVSGFFRRWGKGMCKQVVAVCMDLWSPYLNSVRLHCKKAAAVFDKFHVYSYLSNAIDEVRRAEVNKADAKGKELIKGSRWLWLKKKLKRKQKQTLQDIMAINENLSKAHLLRSAMIGKNPASEVLQ
jgi:transposase